MKQKLFKTMLLLCALVAGTSLSWADDNVSTVSTKFSANGDVTSNFTQTGDITSATWNLSVTWKSSISWQNLDGTKGAQIGSGTNPATGIVLTGSNISGTISSVVVNTSGASGISATVAVSVGGTEFKCSGNSTASLTSSAANYTFTGTGTGDIVITWVNSSSKAIYIKSITTTVETAAVATPTFSPAAGTYTAVQNVTISCATGGSTIYYTTDGSTPTSGSTPYSGPVTIDHSCTLKAIAINGDDESAVASAAYTINLPTNYNLVSSLSSITSGKHYLIASGTEDGTVQVLDKQNSNNRGKKDVTISSGILQATGARELVIQGPDTDGLYTIYDASGSGYLYAASGGNYLRTQASIDNNARWNITIDDESGIAEIVATKSSNRNVMQYNSGSSLFSCYASASQKAVYLFEKDGEATPTESVTVNGTYEFATYASNNALDFTGKSIEAYIAKTKGDGTGVTFTRVNKVPAREGVLLHAASGATLDIPSLAGGTAADAVTGNKFVQGSGSAVVSSDGTNYNYVLFNGGSGLGFYRANGKTVAKNKAYISVQEAPAAVKEFISLPGMEDDADGLEAIDNGELTIDNAAIFNLAGQRLSKMQKGINIVNGKKILY